MKISDFGAVLKVKDKTSEYFSKAKNFNFDTAYASPQQINNKDYTDKCDVFALGCLFFELLVGQTPYRHNPQCSNCYNVMKMDKVIQVLQEKKVPIGMIEFL